MKSMVELIRRYNVSPAYLEEVREKYIPLEYLDPRLYKSISRYKNIRRIKDSETGKVYHETWIQKIIDLSNDDQFVTVTKEVEGRLDIISNIYYNTPKLWWIIAIANDIIDPFDVEIGKRLRIPPVVSLYNKGGILSSE